MDYIAVAGQSIGWLMSVGMFAFPILAIIASMVVDGYAELFVY